MFVVDCGSSDHISSNLSLFTSYSSMAALCYITMPNGQQTLVTHTGTVTLSPYIILNHVSYAPYFRFNLLSTSKLASQLSASVIFTSQMCILQVPLLRKFLILGRARGGLYLTYPAALTKCSTLYASCNSVSSNTVNKSAALFDLWHDRLGHVSLARMKHFLRSFHNVPSVCHICPQAKQHKRSFQNGFIKSSHIFELLHADIWVPFHCTTYNGFKYFLSIVDDFSCAIWVHLLASKGNAFPMLRAFILFSERQFQTPVEVITSDNGLEFCDHTASQFFFVSKDILHQTTCVATPQQKTQTSS